MTDITYIPDHSDRAVARIPSRLRQPVISALVRALVEEIQLLEDETIDTLSAIPVDVAHGLVLDRWGDIVGEPRLGLTDPVFRRVIVAKLSAAQSASRRDYIIAFVKQLFDEDEVTYSDYVHSFRINVTSVQLIQSAVARRVLRLLAGATPAGTQSTIAEGGLDVFRFNRDPGFGQKFGRIL
jgi:hypothetical protein